jgi:adenine-specific DNA-methyltransferase
MARGSSPKRVGALHHNDKRLNIPTAEMQSFFQREEDHNLLPPKHYPRARPLAQGEHRDRDPDRDPQLLWNGMRITLTEAQRRQLAETGTVEIGEAQLVWRGKDAQDWSDLIVQTPPLYIQEKIHPKAIIEGLNRQAAANAQARTDTPDLFSDFNGVPRDAATEFYQHDAHWSNRMILGDSLAVMSSLAERERLKGKVQCVYFDPPYGIKFNSNWQVSTRSRDVKDGKQTDISREPEQVKAFRDNWKDGAHSYLTYLRDRLTVAHDLLTDSGSIFVQIGDENVHRVRAVMDEVFGAENFCSLIIVLKTTGAGSPAISTDVLPAVADHIVWYTKSFQNVKYRRPYFPRDPSNDGNYRMGREQGIFDRNLSKNEMENVDHLPSEIKIFRPNPLTSQTGAPTTTFPYVFFGTEYKPNKGGWKTNKKGFGRLHRANRLMGIGKTLCFVRFFNDFPYQSQNNLWTDTRQSGFGSEKVYVVQTTPRIIERCILMTTDPGDLVLDPTCGSGTTAYVAEQWGRRWITIDTSRVALALARTRLMAARYPWYLLADSPEGRLKEAELTGKPPIDGTTRNDLRQGFVYERVPHITLKSIANNSRIDDIWEKWQTTLEPLRASLNAALGMSWQEWEIPREAGAGWPAGATADHAASWQARIARQREIDTAVDQAADVELLYHRPYPDPGRVRVAGPFTVESLSPHRIAAAHERELIADLDAAEGRRRRAGEPHIDFSQIVIDYLKSAGIHQSDKRGKIDFEGVAAWPGQWIGAEGRFRERDEMRRAAILIGPEYGTLSRPDLTAAAREANEAGFDLLIACAFNFDAHSSELNRLGPLPILKARMNPDLHMSDELKNTGKGNLFVIFGEPDIDIETLDTGELRVTVKGIDVYDPNTGDIRSNDVHDIAAWFIDTEYNEESFFVRHAYFLGANDPYKSLKTALRAEIDEDAWATLYRATSRPFPRPRDGVIAVKVINHFGSLWSYCRRNRADHEPPGSRSRCLIRWMDRTKVERRPNAILSVRKRVLRSPRKARFRLLPRMRQKGSSRRNGATRRYDRSDKPQVRLHLFGTG